MKIPSQVVCDLELHQLFLVDGKVYILLDRDPWTATIARWFWYDKYIVKATNWLHDVADRRDAKRRAKGVTK